MTGRQWLKAGIGTASAIAVAVPMAFVLATSTAGATTSSTTTIADNGPNPSVTGQTITLVATVTGADPTGIVTFEAEPASGGVPITNLGTASLTGTSSSNTATLTTSALTATAPGDPWTLYALYAGDSNNSSSNTFSNPPPDQTVIAENITLADNGPNPSSVGQNVSFTATVNGADPTGNVDFVATPASGSTPTNPTIDLGTAALTGNTNSNTATLTTSVIPANPASDPWVINATYLGDTNNPSVNTDSSTPLVLQQVNGAVPTFTSTTASGPITLQGIGGGADTLSDSAVLAGGNNPTGSITFSAYGPSATPDCSTTAAFVSSPVTVSGNGTYPLPSTNLFTPTTAGSYYWVATYSGDSNNNPITATGACGATGETSVVNPTQPVIATMASHAVQLGSPVTDTATITSAYHLTGQQVTFKLFGPNPTPFCQALVGTTTGTIGISGMAYVATSGNLTPTTAGTYYWVASYGGDVNNNSATGTCGDSSESVQVISGLSPTNPQLPAAPACGTYSQTFSSGLPGSTYSISSPIPPGLSFNGVTGTLSGTPSAAGYYSFRITATTPGQPSVARTYSLRVALCVDGGTAALTPATHGHAYSFQLTSAKGTAPFRFVLQSGALPSGMSLSQSGLVSGTTNQTGNFTFTVYVSDSANPVNYGTQTMTLSVS